uniref:Uncharacterized protein n=1 Tax=Tetranychus urticae TaxID=32264 RepID=T1KS54_TETUR
MVVPVIQEQVKNKELLIEVDSIVNDNKDNLANVSLSSNDSLSKSRRKWRLIRIINKLNPALAERRYQFPTFKFFFALFLIILTSMVIYWSIASRSVANSQPDCPSSISLKSSAPQPVSPSPTPQVSPRIPTKISLQPSTTPSPPIYDPPAYYTSYPVTFSKVQVDDEEDNDEEADSWVPIEFSEEPIRGYEPPPYFPDEELFDVFDYPNSEELTFKFPDSFDDLPDSFALRSTGVNADAVMKSVDKFINFFKSMINF